MQHYLGELAMANQRSNPNKAFPNPQIPSLCYIKNVVKNPRIIIGDYTYYDDVDGADQFENKSGGISPVWIICIFAD